MIVGTDIRHLASGPLTGVGNVTRALIPALADVLDNAELEVFYVGRHTPPTFVSTWPKHHPNCRLRTVHMSNRLFDVLTVNQMLPGSLWESFTAQDVYLSTHMLPVPKMRTPRILVLHDLSFVRHPEFFTHRRRSWHARIRPRAQAERAAALIVPSEATARDAVDLWNIPQKRIHVIPWGAPVMDHGSWIMDRKQKRSESSTRTILFLGTIEKRKNVLGLIRAFALLKQRAGAEDARLVLAGDLGWGSREAKSWIMGHGSWVKERIELRGYVTEEEKAELLSKAAVFVCPSFYEGSGLPVLEAMAAGVPCVVSNRTALPEISGGAALLVDPDRQDEIAQAMHAVLDDTALANILAERGRARAAQFTWEKTATQVAEILRTVARRP